MYAYYTRVYYLMITILPFIDPVSIPQVGIIIAGTGNIFTTSMYDITWYNLVTLLKTYEWEQTMTYVYSSPLSLLIY